MAPIDALDSHADLGLLHDWELTSFDVILEGFDLNI